MCVPSGWISEKPAAGPRVRRNAIHCPSGDHARPRGRVGDERPMAAIGIDRPDLLLPAGITGGFEGVCVPPSVRRPGEEGAVRKGAACEPGGDTLWPTVIEQLHIEVEVTRRVLYDGISGGHEAEKGDPLAIRRP